MKDVFLTARLTLAAVLRGETAAGCAAKRHIGMRVKGILSAEWWNSSKNPPWSVVSYSAGSKLVQYKSRNLLFCIWIFWWIYPWYPWGHGILETLKLIAWKFALWVRVSFPHHPHWEVTLKLLPCTWLHTNKQRSSTLLQIRRQPFICSSGSLLEEWDRATD